MGMEQLYLALRVDVMGGRGGNCVKKLVEIGNDLVGENLPYFGRLSTIFINPCVSLRPHP